MAQQIKPVLTKTSPLLVMVANGQHFISNAMCKSIIWNMQGVELKGDFRFMPLVAYDMVLGMEWLDRLGLMVIDWGKQYLSFEHEGKKVELTGQHGDH